MPLGELLAALGGRLTLYAGPAATPCPGCGLVWTDPSPRGHPSLCLPCTQADIGEYVDELPDRITARLTLAQWLRLPRDDNGRPIPPPMSRERIRKRTR